MLLKRFKTKQGFTLVEIMLACAILALCLTASLQLYLKASSLVVYSRNKTIATTHAKCILEEIRDITTGGIAGTDWPTWLDSLTGVDLLSGESITIDTTNAPLEIPVTISWQEKSRSCSVTLIGGFQA